MLCGVGLYPSCMLWCWFLCFLEFGDYVFELWVNILVPHTTRLPTHPQAFLPTLQTTWTRSTYVFVYTVETLLQVQCQGHQVAKLHIQLKLYSSITSCTKGTGLWEINSWVSTSYWSCIIVSLSFTYSIWKENNVQALFIFKEVIHTGFVPYKGSKKIHRRNFQNIFSGLFRTQDYTRLAW